MEDMSTDEVQSGRGDNMKNVVIVELKTNEEADRAVLEIDDAVRECTAALDAGKVRVSASGLVRNASGLVRDASRSVRGLVEVAKTAKSQIAKFYNPATHHQILPPKHLCLNYFKTFLYFLVTSSS